MKTASLTTLLASAVAVSAHRPILVAKTTNTTLPTTTVAGVEVVDTQIVRDARALISTMEPYLYRHQMRSWLFGVATINNNATLKALIDLEVHALGTLIHDLGWDMTPNSTWVTSDKRFEIDGAIGSRKFITSHPNADQWDLNRQQLVWDAISLHGTTSISEYKQEDVRTIVRSIGMDYEGEHPGIPADINAEILAEFPTDGFLQGTDDTFIWFCTSKPNATYDTWVQPWGEAFVPGYSAVGHRLFDRVHPPNTTTTS
ncbi:Uu.00g097390.m01.CDS01 [Anthostomella pinea]|uniref:Uu.00g097390.m01.CDS01 n=1 Tax=Anthostomella pinea TaxID=933095 RepID=A0AAI8VDD9_9PEZI|nr:Uu.00g097390.m01.CDS01 [Anthostomella pinea]